MAVDSNRLLQEALEARLVQSRVAQYLGEEPGADCLSRVKGHDRGTTIGVPEECVTALPAHN
jgi:hypothetical protein